MALTKKGDARQKPASQGHLIDCNRAVPSSEIGFGPGLATLFRPLHSAVSFSRPAHQIEVRHGKKGLSGTGEDEGGSEIGWKSQSDRNGQGKACRKGPGAQFRQEHLQEERWLRKGYGEEFFAKFRKRLYPRGIQSPGQAPGEDRI
jgi:hypothetical protein